MPESKANILIVDDRPEKLLALEAILEDLQENIIRAYSGRDALRHVLNQELSVILLDVNMPDMDGFETAALIRQRKNSEHIPIIFITALGDEMHATRGYSLGAVDYILTPVIPDVLRTKVAVFVELFKKTHQVKRQARWLQERAAQLHKLTRAALTINSALSMDKLLKVVTDEARGLIDAHVAETTLTIRENASQQPRATSVSDEYTTHMQNGEATLLSRLGRLVCAQNKPVRLARGELQADVEWRKGLAPDDLQEFDAGFLGVPLNGRDGRNIGVIQLSQKIEGGFTIDDEAVLVQLAQMASIAIENTIFYEEREANRLKDEFLATLSHELRTPLNAILGWTHLLRSQDDHENVEHGLEVIERNVKAQTKLIEDLLDVSRITTGKLRLSIQPINLSSVVKAAVEAVRPAAESKMLTLDVTLDRTADALMGDPDRLQQVIWNLLTNAVKFTSAGGQIEVVTQRMDSVARVKVTDNGSGIPSHFLPYVFDRFRQNDSTSTRSHGGLGIGLTIVSHIVSLHGGKVYAESPGEGQGSTFCVDLPFDAGVNEARVVDPDVSNVNQEIGASEIDLSGARVLVVDDELDTREMILELVRRAGAEVCTAGSAHEALEAMVHFRPQVILSDIAMPGEDGYCLIRRIRNLSDDEGGATPTIALTAYARREDCERALSAGFQAHLTKPIEPAQLLLAIRQALKVTGSQSVEEWSTLTNE